MKHHLPNIPLPAAPGDIVLLSVSVTSRPTWLERDSRGPLQASRERQALRRGSPVADHGWSRALDVQAEQPESNVADLRVDKDLILQIAHSEDRIRLTLRPL